jgi:acyl carrier protein
MTAVDPARRIRDQLDIDSMDALNFLIAVHEETGVDIPESDYPRLTTVDGIVSYLSRRVGR